MHIEFLVQMRQSKECGNVRNDEIFNLHLGSGAGPSLTALKITFTFWWPVKTHTKCIPAPATVQYLGLKLENFEKPTWRSKCFSEMKGKSFRNMQFFSKAYVVSCPRQMFWVCNTITEFLEQQFYTLFKFLATDLVRHFN